MITDTLQFVAQNNDMQQIAVIIQALMIIIGYIIGYKRSIKK